MIKPYTVEIPTLEGWNPYSKTCPIQVAPTKWEHRLTEQFQEDEISIYSRKEFDPSTYQVFVAFSSSKDEVGYIGIDQDWEGRDNIISVYVVPKYRRRGIGTALVDMACIETSFKLEVTPCTFIKLPDEKRIDSAGLLSFYEKTFVVIKK